MAGPYIPPHKRGSSGSSSLGNPEVEAERKPEDGYTLNEISNQYFHDHQRLYALNRASETAADGTPTLGFVVVFKHHQPQWPPKLFCHENLELLPKTGTLPSAQIAVFERITESHTLKDHKPRFVYVGWHTITGIQTLEPGTLELIEMLESNYKGPGSPASKAKRETSVNMKWAVVDLTKVEGEEEQSNPMGPLKEIKEKGFTERLEEMRLRASGPAKENEKPSAEDESEEIPKSEDP